MLNVNVIKIFDMMLDNFCLQKLWIAVTPFILSNTQNCNNMLPYINE